MDRVHPYGALQRRWRSARMRAFEQIFEITPETRVLDIGGDAFNWQFCSVQARVTVLNVFAPPAPLPKSMTWVVGDATSLPFDDNEFDIAFSNSVVEHLGTREAQEKFAREARRVGRAYWIQTPNRRFPVEPHLMCPFIQYLPRPWQRRLYPLTPWALLDHPTPAQMDDQFRTLRTLNWREFRLLFPEATIRTEWAFGLKKSFIALGHR